jgi:hypothetical protein
MTPSSRQVLDEVVGENAKAQRKIVDIELLMGEGWDAS